VLDKALTDRPLLLQTDPALFGLAHSSLYSQALLYAARFLEDNTQSLGMVAFLNFAEQCAQLLLPRQRLELRDFLTEDRHSLDRISTLTGRIKALRDNFYAHWDKKFVTELDELFTQYPVSADDLERVFQLCRGVLNHYDGIFLDRETHYEMAGEGYTEWLLRFLDQVLKLANAWDGTELPQELRDLFEGDWNLDVTRRR
jgi:hypothetical protein